MTTFDHDEAAGRIAGIRIGFADNFNNSNNFEALIRVIKETPDRL